MHALAREVEEQTGLSVSRVVAELPNFLYQREKRVLNAERRAQSIRRICIELNFAAEIEGDLIHVNQTSIQSTHGLPGKTLKVWK